MFFVIFTIFSFFKSLVLVNNIGPQLHSMLLMYIKIRIVILHMTALICFTKASKIY